MSVINVTQMWSKRGGAFTSERANALDQKFSFTEGYQVLHEAGDTDDVIAAGSGVPRIGDQHSSGLAAFVKSVNVTANGPIFSTVVIGYDGQTLDPGTVDIEWTDTTTTEPIDRDFDGRAIVTANNEPVDGLSVEISDQVCIIRRQFLTLDTFAISAYRHATNSDTFLGWPPGTARLVAYSAKNKFSRGAPLEQWDVTARIQFRRPLGGATAAQAWYRRWRHEGLYVKNGLFIQRAIDDNYQEKTKPVLLKEDGTEETDPAAAVFKYTKVFDSLAYSGLGLI